MSLVGTASTNSSNDNPTTVVVVVVVVVVRSSFGSFELRSRVAALNWQIRKANSSSSTRRR